MTPFHELRNYLLRREVELARAALLPPGLLPLVQFGRFCTTVIVEFIDSNCVQMAAALAYSSLLALVPVTTLFFSIFTAFTAFEEMRRDFEKFLFGHLFASDTIGDQILVHLDGFQANAKQLGLFALVALIVTVIFLLITVENSLNSIWKVPPRRRMMTRVVTYSALVFLGPLLLAVSFYLTNQTVRVLFLQDLNFSPGLWKFLSSVSISCVMFFLAYITVPEAKVHFRPAAYGGMVAGALFEWAKFGFDQYLQRTHFYFDVYKTLGLVPIFLVWLYLVWLITLLGMVITYVSQNDAHLCAYARAKTGDVEISDAALVATMVQISKNFYEGRPEENSGQLLATELGIPLFQLSVILRHLERAGFVHRLAEQGDTYAPSAPIGHTTIQDLLESLQSDQILTRLSDRDRRFGPLRDAFLRTHVRRDEVFERLTIEAVVSRSEGA